MRMIAVDDDELQLDTLVEYLAELYPDAVIERFTRVSDVLQALDGEEINVAVLDICMPGNINGIALGEILRQKNKRIKLLYCTGYSDYAADAFRIHANGYLQKPIHREVLRKELQYILQMPVYEGDSKPCIHTFGNFDVFVDNAPVVFRRSKSKEILAYLVDREGGWVTNRELIAVLWAEASSDTALSKYITTLVNDMVAALSKAGVGHIVERRRGKMRLLKNEVLCDYYEYLNGNADAKARFHQEYMSQYSWGEVTLAFILQKHPE